MIEVVSDSSVLVCIGGCEKGECLGCKESRI